MVLLCLAGCREVPDSPIKSDERVVFFPTYAHLSADGATWTVRIHGWIHEPERDSVVRRAALEAFRLHLGLRSDDAETPVFQARARAFLVDNERGKEIPFLLGGQVYTTGMSEADGHFLGTVRLPAGDVQQLTARGDADDGWVPFQAITRAGDGRVFAGRVQFIGPTGLSVISDIDDTIKVSNVADRDALLYNTFVGEYEAVEGMADLYAGWAASGACFHYVSASPWQLYEPLAAFLGASGFPAGSFHLRTFRWTPESVSELFGSPAPHKRAAIESILTAFPQRHFILVGDSGQEDPETYATLAREHPEQVQRVLIRDVTGEARDSERYQTVFEDVPEDRWTIFSRPGEIEPQ